MHSTLRRMLNIALFFAAAVLVPEVRAEILESHLDVELAPGYDSNALELPDDPVGGLYTELAVDGGLRGHMSEMWGYLVQSDVNLRRYESGASDGDRARGDLRAGLTLTPFSGENRAFAVAFGAMAGVDRSTYIDPATGEVHSVDDGGTLVRLPDRFDFDSTGAFLDLRWRTGRRVLLYLDSELERRDFVEDYNDVSVIESLDDSSLSMQPGALIQISRRVLLDLSATFRDRRYEELSALDEDAFASPDVRREYRSLDYSVSLELEPANDIEVGVGARAIDREDVHAGYYDYRGSAAFVTFGLKPDEGFRYHAMIARHDLDYENATIDNTVNGETRDSMRLLAVGRVERPIAERFSLFLEAGLDRYDNRDPIYDYDRRWTQAGVRLRL